MKDYLLNVAEEIAENTSGDVEKIIEEIMDGKHGTTAELFTDYPPLLFA